MKNYKIVLGPEPPSQKDTLWAKPVSGGFSLYMLDNGTWQPLKVMDDQDTKSTADDTKATVIQGVKVNSSTLTPSARGIVSISIAEGSTLGCVKVNNSNIKVKGLAGSGTFANKPSSAVAGTQYFCTDKQTTEGETNGIVIYYNGTKWVDALGREVTAE